MLSAHDQIAIARLRRRLAAGNPTPSVVTVFESLIRVADQFSSSPSTSTIWREMEFIVALYETARNRPPF